MRSFKKFIKEGVGAGGSPAVGTTDQNLAVDFNINPSAVQEPEIVKKLNAFIGAVANAEFILPEHGIDKIRRSLSRELVFLLVRHLQWKDRVVLLNYL